MLTVNRLPLATVLASGFSVSVTPADDAACASNAIIGPADWVVPAKAPGDHQRAVPSAIMANVTTQRSTGFVLLPFAETLMYRLLAAAAVPRTVCFYQTMGRQTRYPAPDVMVLPSTEPITEPSPNLTSVFRGSVVENVMLVV